MRSVNPAEAMNSWEQSAPPEASSIEKALGPVLLAVADTLFQDWGAPAKLPRTSLINRKPEAAL